MKKTDFSTLILVLLAFIGILTSGFLLIKGRFSENSNRQEADRVATIHQYGQDVRLKMAGDLHWYPVTHEVSCYKDDTIFTGPESKATLDLMIGGTITLYPNTLLTLSEGRISLDSGSVEINLTQGKLEIESFGEILKVTPEDKIRIENTEKTKRIVPLQKTALTSPLFKNYIEKIQLTLETPAILEKIPKVKSGKVAFKWNSKPYEPGQPFLVEVSLQENFETIISSNKTSVLEYQMNSDELPSGQVYWRVSQASTTQSSSFLHVENFDVENLSPEIGKVYSLEESSKHGLSFEWTNPLEMKQVFQVSQHEDFSQLLANEILNTTTHNMALNSEGQYYWRVGYHLNDTFYWSKIFSFTLRPDLLKLPLSLNQLPKTLDFSLRDTFTVKVLGPEGFDHFEYVLTLNDKVIDQKNSEQSIYRLKRLPDGKYKLTIKATSKTQRMEGEGVKEFEVHTSAPVEAPKIKNKEKVKLLVEVIKKIVANIFPSAHAATNFYYNLEWEEVPRASYEIEVYKNNKGELHLREQVNEPKFRLNISGPEVYYWRVRTLLHGKKGPFSEFALVHIEDKALTLKDPLMLSPGANEHLSVIENGTVTFTWQEPISGKYFLEYSTHPEGKKVKRIPVSRGSKTIKFKKVPAHFAWRIHAESLYGNSNPNQDFYKLNLEETSNQFPFSKVLTRLALFQSNSTFKTEAKDANIKDELDMKGQILDLDVEFFPNKNRRNSYNFVFRRQSLKDGSDKLEEMRLGAEYSWLLNPDSNAHQQFYLGYHQLIQYHFEIAPDIKGDYSAGFLSARYLFRRHLTEKFNIELSSLLQMPTAIDFTPSINLKPALNYRLNPKWFLDFYMLYERFYTRPRIQNGSDKADISLQNMAMGLGLTWNPNNAPF